MGFELRQLLNTSQIQQMIFRWTPRLFDLLLQINIESFLGSCRLIKDRRSRSFRLGSLGFDMCIDTVLPTALRLVDAQQVDN